MFYMETVYLQMAASRELAKEQLRRHDEHDDEENKLTRGRNYSPPVSASATAASFVMARPSDQARLQVPSSTSSRASAT
jgi:hypothetical protein